MDLPGELLSAQSELLGGLVLLALLLIAAEAGFRVGRRGHANADEATRSQIGTIQAAILGVLGLLLAFTFAMAVSRFDARKELVVMEANAIGTASLRGRMLPVPHGEAVERLFRDYVDNRLEASQISEPAQLASATEEHARVIQDQLWSEAVGAAEKDPRSITTGLFTQSLNEVFDIREQRNAALNNRVPESVLLLLVIAAVLAVGIVGYGCGLAAGRATVAQLCLALLIALVILTIIDLDRPRRGLIRVSQESLMNLKRIPN